MSSVKTIAKLVSNKSKQLASLLERASKLQVELVAVQKELQSGCQQLEEACQAEPAGKLAGAANGKPGKKPAPRKAVAPVPSAGKGEEE
jgi:hypothetical protein